MPLVKEGTADWPITHGMANAAAAWWSNAIGGSASFERNLKHGILASPYNLRQALDCDYAPEGLLVMAAAEAGVPLHRFPIKTTMWLYQGRVVVSHGYGAPERTIYSEGDEP